MTSKTRRRPRHLSDATEQLTLFQPVVPERFRLDAATRRRGLRHVATLKAQLEAKYPSKPAPQPRARTRLGERAPRSAA